MRLGAVFITALAACLVGMLSSGGVPVAVVVGGLLLLAIVVIASGLENAATALLALGFFTAPMNTYGLGGGVTVADVFLVGGLLLLVPLFTRTQLRMSTTHVLGISIIVLTGLVAASGTSAVGDNLRTLVLFFGVIFMLPAALLLWWPSLGRVILLASCIVVGEAVSLLDGFAGDHVSGRLYGLTRHPNFFGDAGMSAFAMCIFLWFAVRPRYRWLVAVGVVSSITAVISSGSRADLLACIFIAIMFPLIERSTIAAGWVAAAATAALATIVIAFPNPSPTSAIGRLEGLGSASQSDVQRTQGLQDGIQLFYRHPIRGNGFQGYFDIHSVYLEVAVALGVFGLAAYLLVLWSFLKPLLSKGTWHYLAYAPLGYIALGLISPSLYDRGVWAGIALSVLARRSSEQTEETPPAIAPVAVPTPLARG